MNNKLFIALLLLSLTACDKLPSWMGGSPAEKEKLPGERISVLPVDSALKPDSDLAGSTATVPAVNANTDWPQHTDSFKAESGNLAAGALNTVAHTPVGQGEVFTHTLVPRPVVGGGFVYAMDAAGNISAHYADNIERVKWQSTGVSEEDVEDVVGGGLAYDNGKLYAVSGRGRIAAFDAATGKALWYKSLRIPFRSAPKVAGDKVYALTIDSQLYALSTVNGDLVWDHRGMNETAGIMNSVTPAVSEDMVITPYSSGEIYALAASDGKELWNDGLSQAKRNEAGSLFNGIGGNPVIDGEVVFALSNAGTMAAFHITEGQRVWFKPIASINTPWMAGDYLYVLTSDNTLLCILKFEGRIQWATKLPVWNDEDRLEPITWKGPVMADGRLIVVGNYGRLIQVNATDGKILRQYEIAPDIATAPVIAGGRMYLVGQDATLYSFQ